MIIHLAWINVPNQIIIEFARKTFKSVIFYFLYFSVQVPKPTDLNTIVYTSGTTGKKMEERGAS